MSDNKRPMLEEIFSERVETPGGGVVDVRLPEGRRPVGSPGGPADFADPLAHCGRLVAPYVAGRSPASTPLVSARGRRVIPLRIKCRSVSRGTDTVTIIPNDAKTVTITRKNLVTRERQTC